MLTPESDPDLQLGVPPPPGSHKSPSRGCPDSPALGAPALRAQPAAHAARGGWAEICQEALQSGASLEPERRCGEPEEEYPTLVRGMYSF